MPFICTIMPTDTVNYLGCNLSNEPWESLTVLKIIQNNLISGLILKMSDPHFFLVSKPEPTSFGRRMIAAIWSITFLNTRAIIWFIELKFSCMLSTLKQIINYTNNKTICCAENLHWLTWISRMILEFSIIYQFFVCNWYPRECQLLLFQLVGTNLSAQILGILILYTSFVFKMFRNVLPSTGRGEMKWKDLCCRLYLVWD